MDDSRLAGVVSEMLIRMGDTPDWPNLTTDEQVRVLQGAIEVVSSPSRRAALAESVASFRRVPTPTPVMYDNDERWERFGWLPFRKDDSGKPRHNSGEA